MGDRISFSSKSNSREVTAWRMEKPGRNKTNKTLPVSERADTPPTKNKMKARKKPTTIVANVRIFGCISCFFKNISFVISCQGN
jgi:hypothetical protein